MMLRLNQLIGLLLLSVSLIACAANPFAEPTASITENVGTETATLISDQIVPDTAGVDGGSPAGETAALIYVQIVPGASEKRRIIEEQIPLDNCNGNVPLTSTVERSRSVFHVAEIGTSAELNVSGSLGVPVIGTVEVGSAIAQHYNVTYGEEETVSHSVSVSAKEGSYIVHTVQQYETWETGDLVIIVGDEEAAREPYSFRNSFGVEVIDIKSINGCETPSSESGESQSGPLPTYTAFPTYTLYPTYTPQPITTLALEQPTETPAITATPQNTGLSVGQWYTYGNISVGLTEVEYDTSPTNQVEIEVSVRNVSNGPISFEYGTYTFSLKDNLGNTYTPKDGSTPAQGSGPRTVALNAGMIEENLNPGYCCGIFFIVNHADRNITELIFSISDLSSVDYAEWKIPVNH